MRRPDLPGYDWGIYAAPWWDPAEGIYGPRTLSGYERALAKHAFSLEGGGFWDFDRDPVEATVPRGTAAHVRAEDSEVPCYDRTLLVEYAAAESLCGRQQEVYLAVVVEGLSIRQAAVRLGIPREDLRRYLKRAQRHAERWRAVV